MLIKTPNGDGGPKMPIKINQLFNIRDRQTGG